MKKVLVTLTAGILLQGCYSTPDFSAQANQNQKLITNDSASKVLSKQSYTAAIEVDKFINGNFDKPALKVVVANQKAIPLVISSDDIQVYADGKPVALLDPKTVQTDRIRTAKHMESRVGSRGNLHVSGGPNSGDLPTSYRSFISTQLDQATVAPNQIYVGYITLDVEDLESVRDLKVVMTIGAEQYIFDIVRS